MMTNRERAMNILHYKDVDRLPAVHFGYWNELLDEWAQQGKIPAELAGCNGGESSEVDPVLDKLIGWDFNWNSTEIPNFGLFPRFEEKVIEILPDGSRRVLNGSGVIERIKPGVTSIPAEDDYTLKDREAFETLYKPKMLFSPERIDIEYFKHFNETRDMSKPVGLNLGSVIGQVRDMTSVIGMSYLMYDDEDLFAEIVDTYADMQYQCAKAVLETGAKFDYAHYWEDICFKSGPLLSPEIFNELCAKHYKKRNDLCRQYGIDIISLDCDGVIEKLIPTWLENGVNTMFPLEVGVWGDQFEHARTKFGKDLLGVGGMDKTALRKDKAAVDAEIERIKRLVAMGGYLPCPDHLLMPGTKFELVQYYADRIKSIRI